MRCCARRNFDEEVPNPKGDQQHAPIRWQARFIDTFILATLIAAIVIAATWVAQPRLHIQAAANDSNRALVGFWPAEQNAGETFRWSRTDSAVRLFGFDQQGPVVIL